MDQNELDDIIKMRFTIVFLIIAILAIQSTLQAPERSKRASASSETIKQVAEQLQTIGEGLAKQALAPLHLGSSLAGMIGGWFGK
uniref:Secreted protein n=1 Tax=Strongyloides stercoralis TaxID=6248 RepID=A0A0K0EIN1_STRER